MKKLHYIIEIIGGGLILCSALSATTTTTTGADVGDEWCWCWWRYTSYDVDVETEGRGLLPTTGQRLIRTRYGSEELLHDKSVLNEPPWIKIYATKCENDTKKIKISEDFTKILKRSDTLFSLC